MTIFGGHVLYDRRQKMALEENVILKFVATTGQHHYVREPPSYLECSICEQLLQDPVVCESGSHLFCRRCLVQWMKQSPTPSCPIDREAFKTGPEGLKRAPRALQDCIDALEVICALGESPRQMSSQYIALALALPSPVFAGPKDAAGPAGKHPGRITFAENALKLRTTIPREEKQGREVSLQLYMELCLESALRQLLSRSHRRRRREKP